MSIFFVVLSTLTLTLNTIPELRERVFNDSMLHRLDNFSDEYGHNLQLELANEDNYYYTENHLFELVEVICIAWFTLEYCLRLWSSPNKGRFLKGALK